MILVTGGAGFIGSNVVAALNENGCCDVAVNDVLGSDQKWRNLAKRQIADFVFPEDLDRWLKHRELEAVVHLGAISSTTVTDGDAVMKSNFALSLRLLDWCTETRVPFIYASSAATYGDRETRFDDEWSSQALKRLSPMNLYGWSKHLFDQLIVERFETSRALPPKWYGLKFFNVYGPNEYHKGAMASVLSKVFDSAKAGKSVKLFKSHRDGVADGDQRRDFIHIDDVVSVILFFLRRQNGHGIYNVGTGQARSFREMIVAMFDAFGRPPNIEYVDMPFEIRDTYQYFTESNVTNLRRAGYNSEFTSLGDGVRRYVCDFLDHADRYR